VWLNPQKRILTEFLFWNWGVLAFLFRKAQLPWNTLAMWHPHGTTPLWHW
jgi:hypothetical protein